MNGPECYSRTMLRDYALGFLADQDSRSIEEHLTSCPTCEDTVVALDTESDTVVRRLQTPHEQSRYLGDDGYRQALRRAQSLPTGPEPSDAPVDAPGQIRDYQLLERLGTGGMGSVYRAIHTRLDMPVAVKILPDHRLRDSGAVARFQREMRAVGTLDHPSIVRATDAGESEGVHFLAMELVEGVDLGRLLQTCGPLTAADACEIIRQAAMGIQHAHDRGIVHRDIKPSNVMLTATGSIKILDLGLALLGGLRGTVDELTTVGQLMGTLDYMAPEQCGDSREVDQRADIYSLGATLYKLMSGEPPYGGQPEDTPLQRLTALVTETVPPIGQRDCTIPAGLSEVVHRALARDPAERFASADELAEALQPYAKDSQLKRLWQRYRRQLAELVKARDKAAEKPAEAASLEFGDLPLVQPAAPRRGLRIALGLVLTAVLILAGILIHIETGKGRLTIECPDDGLVITLHRAGKFYDRLELEKGDNVARVRAGNYELRLEGEMDGIDVRDGQFTIKRRGTWVAKIVEDRPTTVAPPSNRSLAKYEGKTFGEWAEELETELSPSRRATAIRALVTLGKGGRTQEALRVILSAVRAEELNNSYGVGPGQTTIESVMLQEFSTLDLATQARAFESVLKDGESSTRQVALRMIASHLWREPPQELMPIRQAILDASRDANSKVRRLALDALVMMPPFLDGMEVRTAEMMRDPDLAVRSAAATTMMFVNRDHNELVSTLAELTTEVSGYDLQNVVTSLKTLGPRAKSAAPALTKLVASKDAWLRVGGSYDQPLPGDIEGRLKLYESGGGGFGGGFGGGGGGLATLKCLQDFAIEALGAIGPSAKSALPVLDAEFRRRLENRAAGVAVQQGGFGGGLPFSPDPELVRKALDAIRAE